MLEKLRELAEGQGLLEYALILVLVAIVVIGALALLGPAIGNIFSIIVEGGLTISPGGGSPDPPGDCYGSLLMPIMVGVTGLGVGVSAWLAKRTATDAPA